MHPVLTDTDFTAEIVLTHADGMTTSTRGQLTRRPEREEEAEAPGRLAIHAPTPDHGSIVETITALDGTRFDVLESEPFASGLTAAAFAAWDSTIYIVRRAPVVLRDFSAADFDTSDFA